MAVTLVINIIFCFPRLPFILSAYILITLSLIVRHTLRRVGKLKNVAKQRVCRRPWDLRDELSGARVPPSHPYQGQSPSYYPQHHSHLGSPRHGHAWWLINWSYGVVYELHPAHDSVLILDRLQRLQVQFIDAWHQIWKLRQMYFRLQT